MAKHYMHVTGLGPEKNSLVSVDLPSNSKKSQQAAEKKVGKVIKGEVVKKKKPLSKKFAETFITDDLNEVREYLIHDVAVPAIKSTISDGVSQAIEMILFGENARPRNGVKREGNRSYVSYSNYYRKEDSRSRNSRSSNRSRHSFDDVLLESRAEAEEVLSCLVDLVETYNQASVADLYDLVGMTSEFTDNKWGWEELGSASVRRTRDGYLLDLPRPIVLDN